MPTFYIYDTKKRNPVGFGYSNNLGVPTLGVYFRGQL